VTVSRCEKDAFGLFCHIVFQAPFGFLPYLSAPRKGFRDEISLKKNVLGHFKREYIYLLEMSMAIARNDIR
jgi:hypothetical protein